MLIAQITAATRKRPPMMYRPTCAGVVSSDNPVEINTTNPMMSNSQKSQFMPFVAFPTPEYPCGGNSSTAQHIQYQMREWGGRRVRRRPPHFD